MFREELSILFRNKGNDMEKFYMRLADKVVAVSANYQSTKGFCKKYLVEEPSEIDVEVNIDLADIEEEKKVAQDAGLAAFSDQYLETLALHRKVSEELTKYNTVLFHGSAIAVDGEVYLFTAPSGTGKSTHTRLWRECFGERAIMVNDDKPFLHLNEDGSITVYGAPWDGKHHLSTNVGMPLKAICILSQAPENKIEKVSKKDGLQPLYLQTFWSNTNKGMVKNSLEVLSGILNQSLWHLECNISKEAVKVSYEAMSGKSMEEI